MAPGSPPSYSRQTICSKLVSSNSDCRYEIINLRTLFDALSLHMIPFKKEHLLHHLSPICCHNFAKIMHICSQGRAVASFGNGHPIREAEVVCKAVKVCGQMETLVHKTYLHNSAPRPHEHEIRHVAPIRPMTRQPLYTRSAVFHMGLPGAKVSKVKPSSSGSHSRRRAISSS
jgi:hypothetical protein